MKRGRRRDDGRCAGAGGNASAGGHRDGSTDGATQSPTRWRRASGAAYVVLMKGDPLAKASRRATSGPRGQGEEEGPRTDRSAALKKGVAEQADERLHRRDQRLLGRGDSRPGREAREQPRRPHRAAQQAPPEAVLRRSGDERGRDDRHGDDIDGSKGAISSDRGETLRSSSASTASAPTKPTAARRRELLGVIDSASGPATQVRRRRKLPGDRPPRPSGQPACGSGTRPRTQGRHVDLQQQARRRRQMLETYRAVNGVLPVVDSARDEDGRHAHRLDRRG